MKKKLLLSSILTPIIPAAALVSCGNGVIVIDDFVYEHVLVAFSKTRLPYQHALKRQDYDLSFNANIITSPELFDKGYHYATVLFVGFVGGVWKNTADMNTNPNTTTIKNISYNGNPITEGNPSSDDYCWFYSPDGEDTNLVIKFLEFTKDTTISISLSGTNLFPDNPPVINNEDESVALGLRFNKSL